MKATCYFEQIIDVGRDQAATEQALASLREVVRRFTPPPNTPTDAKLKIDMVNDQLAGKEMAVGRFYLRAGQPLSAIGRFRTVIDKYQTTSDAPRGALPPGGSLPQPSVSTTKPSATPPCSATTIPATAGIRTPTT